MATSLKRWRVHYRDEDPASPTFTTILRGADRSRVEEDFLDAEDGEGWVIVKIEPIREAK